VIILRNSTCTASFDVETKDDVFLNRTDILKNRSKK
jgi:hypothetical protein